MTDVQDRPAVEELTPDELASFDAAYWAVFNKLKLQAGNFTFTDHEYQFEPMHAEVRRCCYIKGTQGGWSEVEILKSLHGLIHKRYPQGVLYMFPTTDNVHEFSKSRFNPLISANRESIGQFVKSHGKGTDTTSLKKIHGAFLYLRGARLSQRIGPGMGEGESVQLKGIPVDRVVYDEVDLMDEAVVMKAKGRMGHSKLKEEVYLSNPTLPDFGIDKLFQASDQRHLFRKCEGCGHWTCAELSFPECVKVGDKGWGYIGCGKCGKPVGFSKIEWVVSCKENTDYMHGYRWSQLSSPFNDPAEILDEYNNPPQGNLADVYRLRLGLPYVAAEDKLSADVVAQCYGRELMPVAYSGGQCAMGVDVGKIKHIVIGTRTGKESYEILKIARLSSWTDIHDLARKFNVKSAVIDIRPYEDEARRFQAAEPYRIFLCEYSDTSTTGVAYNEKTGMVKVNRTEIFDATHRMVAERTVKLPRQCTEMTEMTKQLCNCAKVLEVNKRTNAAIYRYRTIGTGGDHYRNALNYFRLAAGHCRITRTVPAGGEQRRYAINEPVKI